LKDGSSRRSKITKLADGKGELESQLRQASEAQGQEAVASARLLEEAVERAGMAEHMVRALKKKVQLATRLKG